MDEWRTDDDDDDDDGNACGATRMGGTLADKGYLVNSLSWELRVHEC